MRINKFLAHKAGYARRKADELVASGRVRINASIARPGNIVTKNDEVFVDNKLVHQIPRYVYLMLNKPTGYVCSHRQQGVSPTIYRLVPKKFQNLKSAGRLDRDSSGLIILTDDGDFVHQLTHPRFKKEKVYHVKLDRELNNEHLQQLNQGVSLDDGPSHILITHLRGNPEYKKRSPNYEVRMVEGRNRQIRRTFAALGYKVTDLKRVKFGLFELGTLKIGDWREIIVDQATKARR